MNRYIRLAVILLILGLGGAQGQDCTPRSSLPTFCISTQGETPVTSKEDYVNGNLSIIQQGQAEQLYSGGIRIRGRGNSTWGLEKKPYRINLNTAGSLLGMPASARNWVLLANHADKTLLRNSVGLELSRYVGMPYASPFRFVDVILNGEYLGSYLLTDHMEVRAKRVDIEEDKPESEVGAYLVEIDGFATSEDLWLTTSRELTATIKYPDISSSSDPHYRYIENHINEFEERLFSGKPAEGPGGYLERVDLQSLVNWYLVCELAGNPDSFWSVYIHKRRSDDRFFLGPHWDFDIAFDNDVRFGDARYRLMAEVGQNFIFRQWIEQLRKDDYFMTAVKTRWNELKSRGLRDHILSRVEEYTGLLVNSGSARENYQRWPVLNRQVYLEVKQSGTYEEHVEFLVDYLKQRFEWLDRELNGPAPGFNYKLVNASTDLALSVQEDRVVQRKFEEKPEFIWQIQPLDNGFGVLYHPAANSAVTRRNGINQAVYLSELDPDNPLQQWRITESARGKFSIISRDGQLGLQNRDRSGEEMRDIHSTDIRSYDPNGIEVYDWYNNAEEGKWIIERVEVATTEYVTSLTGKYIEKAILLEWTISGPAELSFVEVERLNENGEYQVVANLPSTASGEYTWTDRDPLPGVNVYRLKLVNSQGAVTYSSTLSVLNRNIHIQAYVYPNPAVIQPKLRIYTTEAGEIEAELLNAQGIVQKKFNFQGAEGLNEIELDYTDLRAGLYVMRVRQNGNTAATKFVAYH